jgi:hypothetical protein
VNVLTVAPWAVIYPAGASARIVSARGHRIADVIREEDARAIANLPLVLEELRAAIELIESLDLDATPQREALALALGRAEPLKGAP